MSEEQFELFQRRLSVIERCKGTHGHSGDCVVIFDKQFKAIRTEPCRIWCPLLKECIDISSKHSVDGRSTIE